MQKTCCYVIIACYNVTANNKQQLYNSSRCLVLYASVSQYLANISAQHLPRKCMGFTTSPHGEHSRFSFNFHNSRLSVIIIIAITIPRTMFMMLIIAEPLREFTQFMWWMQNSARCWVLSVAFKPWVYYWYANSMSCTEVNNSRLCMHNCTHWLAENQSSPQLCNKA